MQSKIEKERERCIKVHEERGDFVCDIDGFIKYWPEGSPGYMESHHLRWVADELDKRNKKWSEMIDTEVGRFEEDRTDVDFGF
jgi:hypothetical protein